jgi:hypothetical protein
MPYGLQVQVADWRCHANYEERIQRPHHEHARRIAAERFDQSHSSDITKSGRNWLDIIQGKDSREEPQNNYIQYNGAWR